MRIGKLTINNFKGVEVLELDINSDTSIVEITGKPGSGKSSILDAIYWALSAKNSSISNPVRLGSKRAEVKLELNITPSDVIQIGNLLVTRVQTSEGKPRLVVERTDGQELKMGPQEVLDKLLGTDTIDPLSFMLQEPATQVNLLCKAIGFDLNSYESEYKKMYDERRDVNRDLTKLKTQLGSRPIVNGQLLDESIIQIQIRDAQATIRSNNEKKQELEGLKSEYRMLNTRKSQIEEQIAKLQAELIDVNRRIVVVSDKGKQLSEQINGTTDPDIQTLLTQLDSIRKNNSEITHKQSQVKEWDNRSVELQTLESKSIYLTERLDSLNKTKLEAISNSPLKTFGIEIEEKTIKVNSIPVSDLSTNEQFRIACNIAMSQKRDLKVLRIKEGGLISEENLNELSTIASNNGYLALIEVVDRTGITNLEITQH